VLQTRNQTALAFPYLEPPKTGEAIEIAPGILWTRVPLPFRLNHVNIYLIDDGDGWVILDTGIDNDPTRLVWESLLRGPLSGRPLTRIIVTHYHPDHIGLAGWLCERFGMPLLTTQTTYLSCLNISLSPGALDAKPYRDFYIRHGLDSQTTQIVATQGHNYLRMVYGLPPVFTRIVGGDTLKLGGRSFCAMTGDGHAPEQLTLYSTADKILLAADQVLAKITPNVSVWAVDPNGDPLGLYLRSLHSLKRQLSPDALVLPGHQLPFYGVSTRIDELIAHHDLRCGLIRKACSNTAHSAAELVPVIFHRKLDPHQMSFAFSEVLAHINYMLRTNELNWVEISDGIERVIAR
jgi:glyoxylase-like metal-dependent hydrolase (beta-lactamase superfamily II)